MNKEPKEIDWSQAKPGSKGVTRTGSLVEFIAHREGTTCFYHKKSEWLLRFANGRLYEHRQDAMDVLCPWEQLVAEGHNPDKLTNEQVGDGYRLIQNYTEPADPRAEYYNHDKRVWLKREDQSSYIYGGTYRVPIAKPKRRVPCGPEHFPPGTVVRATEFPNAWQMVIWVQSHGIGSMTSQGEFISETYGKLIGFNGERSTDGGKTWLPCYVEVEE